MLANTRLTFRQSMPQAKLTASSDKACRSTDLFVSISTDCTINIDCSDLILNRSRALSSGTLSRAKLRKKCRHTGVKSGHEHIG